MPPIYRELEKSLNPGNFSLNPAIKAIYNYPNEMLIEKTDQSSSSETESSNSENEYTNSENEPLNSEKKPLNFGNKPLNSIAQTYPD